VTVDIVTIFSAMIEQPLAAGVLGRAIERGTLDVTVRDLRDFTTDRHRVVDDVPFGGGPGMVLKPEPLFRALDVIEADRGEPLTIVLTSPQGRPFTQADAERLSRAAHLVLLCGRYEGVDERVRQRATEELSIGDYVLSGASCRRWSFWMPWHGSYRASWEMPSRWRTIRSAAGSLIFPTIRGPRRSSSAGGALEIR